MGNNDFNPYAVIGGFILLLLILAHLFMVVFTFGHAANNKRCDDNCFYAYLLGTIPIGLGWPFYWSWELQQEKEPSHD